MTREMGTSTIDAAYWEERAKKAEAEVERLREALREIAAYPHSENGGEIARRTLEPKP